jgi:hypothetical protein
MLADTDVLEELAVSFRVEVCGFRNKLGYMGILQGRWSWDPRRGGKERNTVQTSGNKWTKLALIRVTLVYCRRW